MLPRVSGARCRSVLVDYLLHRRGATFTANLATKAVKCKKNSPAAAVDPREEEKRRLLEWRSKHWTMKVQRYQAFLFVNLHADDVSNTLKCANSFLAFAPDQVIEKNVNLLNVFLLQLCTARRTKMAEDFLQKMLRRNVRPNLATISALLQLSVDQQQQKIDANLAKKALDLCEKYNLDVGAIFGQKVHGLSETDAVLSAIQSVVPDFRPNPYPLPNNRCIESLHYECKLLKNAEQPVPADSYAKDGPYVDAVDDEILTRNFSHQLKRELNCRFRIPNVSVVSSQAGNSGAETNKIFNAILHDWRLNVGRAFGENLKNLKRISTFGLEDAEIAFLMPFLKCLPFNDYVDIMCDSIWILLTTTEVQHAQVSYVKGLLGRSVYQKFVNKVQLDHRMDEKMTKIYRHYLQYFKNSDLSRRFNQRQFWLKCALECFPEQPNIRVDVPEWPYKPVILKMGEYLLDIILKEVKIDANFRPDKLIEPGASTTKKKPLFYKVFCDSGAELREHLRVEPCFLNFLQNCTSLKHKLVMEATAGPMLCPPVPWHARRAGYFLFTPVDLIRTPAPFGRFVNKIEQSMKQYPDSQFHPALDALNQLGSTPWVVNGRVLDTALSVFRSKLGDSKLAVPPEIGTLPSAPKLPKKGSADFVQIAKTRRENSKVRRETYSLWMTALYKLSLANYFRNEVLWFPHSLDFRGRAYPCPPHLNHMGDDLNRGILLFAKGRKLGKHGLDWLKIHCINLTGLKKHDSLKDRLFYANEILSDILDSADDPLNGKRWWRQSEEPWQTLAVCQEISNAVRSPDPSEYISRCPVHQDGSCNGLQHYAALGRDELGGKQVNLVRADTPQDVYSCIAGHVEQRRCRDAAAGVEIARVCEGFVRRKVVKQTVMTVVYGVTTYGARFQIERQLRDLAAEFPSDRVSEAAHYLTGLTFASIGALFNNARRIQDWLCEVAGLLSRDLGRPVEWVTPLDLPVLQPYFTRRRLDPQSSGSKGTDKKPMSNGTRSVVSHPRFQTLPDSRKQRNAFPPNFIHSLDSSHMMLTALHCQRHGLTYASVHDCFWTHAQTVQQMNEICRQQFVALHQEPILTHLSNNLKEKVLENRHPSSDLPSAVSHEVIERIKAVLRRIPPSGTLNLDDVLESPYFFS